MKKATTGTQQQVGPASKLLIDSPVTSANDLFKKVPVSGTGGPEPIRQPVNISKQAKIVATNTKL